MRSRTFGEVWNNADDFYTDAGNMGIPKLITEASYKTLFYLLYARYADSHFANENEVQAKLKIFSTIFKYGPTWEKKLDIQASIRALTLDDLREGAKQITNHANNPNTAPSTSALTELEYIDEQHQSNFKKSKVDAYMTQWDMLVTDVTEEFINRFNKCFMFITDETDVYIYKEEV